MLNALESKIGGDQFAEHSLDETAGQEHSSRRLLIRTSLDGLRDERNPRVENTILETPKWFTKGHVTDYIKGRKV